MKMEAARSSESR